MTVRSSQNELLRGASIGVFKYARETNASRYIYRKSYWTLLQQSGFNAIRVVFFDPWQRSHGRPGSKQPYPFTDLDSKTDVQQMIREFDHLVNTARRKNMHILINYHDTGGYHDPMHSEPADKNRDFARSDSFEYLLKFWNIVAPRYADQQHVFYELTNEPVRWTPDKYTTGNLRDFKKVYDLVRKHAPETHVVLLSFANHSSPDPNARSMIDVARDLRKLGIDFNNESIAFHAYNSRYPAANDSHNIVRLMTEFPVINTEQNFPANMIRGSSDPDASGFDGDRLGVQSMERLGISWFHWQCDTPQRIRENFAGVVVPDAKQKGYFWKK